MLRLLQAAGSLAACCLFFWVLDALMRLDAALNTTGMADVPLAIGRLLGAFTALMTAIVVCIKSADAESEREIRGIFRALNDDLYEVRARPLRAVATLGALASFFASATYRSAEAGRLESVPRSALLAALTIGCGFVLVVRAMRSRPMLELTTGGLRHAWTRAIPWRDVVGVDIRISDYERLPDRASLDLCVRRPASKLRALNSALRWLPLLLLRPPYARLRIPLHGLDERPQAIERVLHQLREGSDGVFLPDWDRWMPMAEVAAAVRVLELERNVDTVGDEGWSELHRARRELERVRSKRSARVIRGGWVVIGLLSLLATAMAIAQIVR